MKETVELPQEPVFDEQPPSEEERRERRRRVEQTIQEVEEEYGTIDDGADSDPFIQDLHEEREPELPTLELPSIKAYADAEAYRLEEERRRIMEEAQREARNTIHNAAQFAMQMEITRRHMAALKEEGSEQRESYEEPEEIGMGNQLFGEVDDQFRAFFSNTVVVDKAAMDEAVNGHKKQGFFHKLFHKRSVEETAPLSGEYDALMPGTSSSPSRLRSWIFSRSNPQRTQKSWCFQLLLRSRPLRKLSLSRAMSRCWTKSSRKKIKQNGRLLYRCRSGKRLTKW